jgi:hypothetical protein
MLLGAYKAEGVGSSISMKIRTFSIYYRVQQVWYLVLNATDEVDPSSLYREEIYR